MYCAAPFSLAKIRNQAHEISNQQVKPRLAQELLLLQLQQQRMVRLRLLTKPMQKKSGESQFGI